jgi:putative spermidine/putrescine transport system substrate-binding protein
MAGLVAAAKGEGSLNVIALPRGWCNYGALLDGFKATYGLVVNSINPNGVSADELQAIVTSKTSPGPSAPDVIDVGVASAAQAKTQSLIQPYKVSTWVSIDPNDKDPDGYWYGDYYGVLSFEVNTKVVTKVPADWADLLKPDYKNKIALAGDPLSSDQAIQSVYAAALSNGGSLDNAQPGLDFFKKLNAVGNLVHTIGTSARLALGQTPIVITWSYLALADRDAEATRGGPPIQVVIPTSGRFGEISAQAISAFAPHPNAAKLWEEYLYSDAGQDLWLTGNCYTTRYADLKARNAIAPATAAKLPDVTGAVFPTVDQLAAARTLIIGHWKAVVGATIK